MKYIILLLIISTGITSTAQNAFDENGLRTGPWKGYYPDTTLKYEANFEKGKPAGLMNRYNREGILSATMNFYPGTNRCFTKFYSEKGKVKAAGVYDSQKKDSIWQYLGSDGSVRMIEIYNNGNLSGVSKTYYPSGNISREIDYNSGKKNGVWMQFFENGDTMMTALYKDDMLNGYYYSYYPEGKLQISGTYLNDLKDGDWIYFSEEQDTLTIFKYDNGEILNPEAMEKSYENFINRIEDNIGDFPDPAIDFE